MSDFPEPRTFNGAPGEAAGDDRRDEGPSHGGFTCLDCRWRGRSGADAYAHHRIAHHRIVLKRGRLQQQFSCCPDGQRQERRA